MSAPVIKVENLSKQYRIGERQGYKTFREAIVNLSKAPFRKWNGSNPHVKIRNLQSDTIWALKNVSFEVKQGEVVGVIGRNGAGKSTLLKILSKITEPTSGRVEIKGRVGSLLEVGTGFHPELTGHENIYLYGAILGMDRWEVTRKFDEIVAFSELDKFIDTPVKRYSSGMYTRLAFAVAAHLEPEILLVDEVLAVGDSKFQKKCLGKMESVSGEGRTVLFVSHNMAAIQGLCDKTILLDSGGLVFYGETAKAIETYTLSGEVATDAKVSLKDHANRAPGCEAVLEELEIRVNGEPSTNVGMGESLEVSVSFKSPQAVRGVGISVEDSFGRRLFIASPNYTNPDLLGSSTTCAKLICNFPCLPLLPGTYYLTISVAGFITVTLDKIERAVILNVSERDVFKTGVRLGKDKGILFTFFNWRLDSKG
jgi:lipopolysaccharide transport system ATP-binding protein